MQVVNYTTPTFVTMNRKDRRLRFLRETMFPVFEWYEIMKKEELDEYCELVTKWDASSKRIWSKMLQIYYQIHFREKLFGLEEHPYQQ